MAPLPAGLCDEIYDWGCQVVPECDVFTNGDPAFGREAEPHVTVLYGVYGRPSLEVQPFRVTLGRVGLFSWNPAFDVVKVEAESEGLVQTHLRLAASADCVRQYRYSPHVTVAFVRKGSVNRLWGSDVFAGREFDVGRLILSE